MDKAILYTAIDPLYRLQTDVDYKESCLECIGCPFKQYEGCLIKVAH
jgi:hypothetical protein